MSQEEYPCLPAGTRVRLNAMTIYGHTGLGTVVSCEGSGASADVKIQLDQCRPGELSGCHRHEVTVLGKGDREKAPGINDYKHELRYLRWNIDYLGELASRTKKVLLRMPFPGIDNLPDDYNQVLNELDIAIIMGKSEGQERPFEGSIVRGEDMPQLQAKANPVK